MPNNRTDLYHLIEDAYHPEHVSAIREYIKGIDNFQMLDHFKDTDINALIIVDQLEASLSDAQKLVKELTNAQRASAQQEADINLGVHFQNSILPSIDPRLKQQLEKAQSMDAYWNTIADEHYQAPTIDNNPTLDEGPQATESNTPAQRRAQKTTEPSKTVAFQNERKKETQQTAQDKEKKPEITSEQEMTNKPQKLESKSRQRVKEKKSKKDKPSSTGKKL